MCIRDRDGAWSDANGIGRFHYQPPAGALALCSRNLQPAVSFAGYDFEETGKVLTYSGNVEISKNSPYLKEAQSLDFSAGRIYFDDDTHFNYNFGADDFTVETWVDCRSTNGMAIFNQSNSNAGSDSSFILWVSDGNIGFYVTTGTSWTHYVIASSINIANTGWRHVAATRKGNTRY